MKKACKILFAVLATTITINTTAEPRNLDELNWRLESRQEFSKRELHCLAENIYWESRGEPVEGQVAVAQVTINRKNLGLWGRDLCQVVYYKRNKVCHFSWVCKPQAQRKHPEHWAQAQLVAKRVADIHYTQYQYKYRNTTHFHNTTVSPAWGRKLKPVKQVKNHIFYEL